MDNPLLADALQCAERALERIERATASANASRGEDDALRKTVRGVVAELDEMLRTAEAS